MSFSKLNEVPFNGNQYTMASQSRVPLQVAALVAQYLVTNASATDASSEADAHATILKAVGLTKETFDRANGLASKILAGIPAEKHSAVKAAM